MKVGWAPGSSGPIIKETWAMIPCITWFLNERTPRGGLVKSSGP